MRELVAAAGLDVAALKRVRVGGYRLPRELGIGQARARCPAMLTGDCSPHGAPAPQMSAVHVKCSPALDRMLM